LNGDGDDAFKWAIDRAAEIIDEYQPTVILLAAGADGHEEAGNLGKLNNYTYEGFAYAAEMVAKAASKYAKGRVLIGGAGGYRPLDHTPEIWARVTCVVSS
jgi:acetoin utilization deacetylase AcuC-like enzyme